MKKTLVFVIIALCSSVTAFILYRNASPFIQQVDLRLKDVRFKLRGTERPDPRVVVVAIDNKSIKEIGRWPWSRTITAGLIRALQQYDVRVVALDVVFSEPQSTVADRTLADAFRKSGNVVAGYFFRNDAQASSTRALEQLANARVKLLRLDAGVTSVPVPQFSHVDANIPEIGAGALDHGFFNVTADDDGLFRKTPLLALFDEGIYPSLSLKALARYRGEEARVEVASFGISSIALGDQHLPVTEGGEPPP